jgi:hypothetical protein
MTPVEGATRMRGRLTWIVVAPVLLLALLLAPLGLPPFAMTLLTEAVILGLFAMSLDLMFGSSRSAMPPPTASAPMPAAGCCCTPACRCCSRCSPRRC